MGQVPVSGRERGGQERREEDGRGENRREEQGRRKDRRGKKGKGKKDRSQDRTGRASWPEDCTPLVFCMETQSIPDTVLVPADTKPVFGYLHLRSAGELALLHQISL